MIRIILVRHGHVEGVEPERFRGRVELALTPAGLRQAELTARRIAGAWRPGAVYTTPMQRCVQTGERIGAAVGVEPRALASLQDIDYGPWQWKTFDQVRALDPKRFDLWRRYPHLIRFPGGEALQDLVARTADVLRLVLSHHEDDTVVVVEHDSTNRALLLQLLELPLSAYWRFTQSPCGVSEIRVDEGVTRSVQINETHHLLEHAGGLGRDE